MLDCYILYMCMLHFLYAFFEGSPAGEADKIDIFFKKNLMFLGSPMNVRGSYSLVMFLSYIPQFPDEHKGLCSSVHVVDQRKPMFISPDGLVGLYSSGYVIYVPQL
jgi:hypothetical protein